MNPYQQFLLKKYRGLLGKAHRLMADSLKTENPDKQLEFISDHYGALFEAITETGNQLEQILRQSSSHEPEQGQNVSSEMSLWRTRVRHILLLLDAVDRNLEELKDRALRDVFQNHVGAHIRAFLEQSGRT